MSSQHRTIVCPLMLAGLFFGLVGTGNAQPLKQSSDFERALRTTKTLPWYEAEPIPKDDQKASAKTCGYRIYVIRQERIGAKWGPGKIAWGFVGTGQTKKVDPCTFAAGGGKWKAVEKLALKLLKEAGGEAAKISRGDKIVIQDDWDIERHKISGAVVGRVIGFRHYSKSFTVKVNNCLSPSDKVVCEGSGSKTAKALNIIHHRLEQARKHKTGGDTRLCSIASWGVVKTARWVKKFRDEQKSDRNWGEGYTYKTRWDGELTEDQAFALITKSENEAEGLFKACGGPSPLPLEARDYSLEP